MSVVAERSIADQTAIIGIGQTEYAKRGGIKDRSEFQLCLEAITTAADDAGIRVQDIDGFCSFGYERPEPVAVQAALGIPAMRFANMVWGAGGGGCAGAVMNAALAVHGGMCKNVVVYRSLCQGQFERYGQFRARPRNGNFMAPFGLMSPAQMVAMTTQRHMHLYGTTTAHLGEVAVNGRANALHNPHAIMRDRPLTREQHAAARPIAHPFRLYDCCLETDGACAVIVTSKERARDARNKPARLLAAAQASGPGWGLGPMGAANMPIEDFATTNSVQVAKALFGMAGLKPADIDVAQIYDAFTGIVIMALEDYGFCKRGEGGPFAASGALRWPDGKLPINTAGGLLSEAYLHGLNLVVEGVRQMRGTSTAQVKGAETCLVTSGGAAGHKSALILGVS